MGLFNLFSGPSPEKMEARGDALLEAGRWGEAKLAYEGALRKLETDEGQTTERWQLLAAKISRAREELAREHRRNAAAYMGSGYPDEARELLALAVDVSPDGPLKQELESELQALDPQQAATDAADLPVGFDTDASDAATEDPNEDYFLALCSTLPGEVQTTYMAYGDTFKAGYIALNQGDFEQAADLLSRAMDENPEPDAYVPLELATAWLNLNQPEKALRLLLEFRKYHPEALPACQLLCEIYWEQNDFDAADALLTSLPEALQESVAVVLMKGKNRFWSGHPDQAVALYRDVLSVYGWNEPVARELAKSYAAVGDRSAARGLYKEIMGRCNTCRSRIDPMVKHEYAELAFADGLHGSDVLELYLSLARELPDRRAHYFDRISVIYTSQGNRVEAERFAAFAVRARAETGDPEPL